jgi:hypothetical protein
VYPLLTTLGGLLQVVCVHSLLVEEEGKNEGIRTERIKKGEKEKRPCFNSHMHVHIRVVYGKKF